MMVRISHNNLSSRRTKNKINEHGNEFFLKNRANDVFGFMGVDCVLLVSPKDNWFGWVPENEIEIVPMEESVN